MPRSRHPSQRQRGAVIVTVCLLMLFLLGFMGIALDFGRLFIVKTEVQTAVDSCALAAAQELDGQPTALTRATSAAMSAANLNRVNLQSASWSGEEQITADSLSFRNAGYNLTTSAADARYAVCQHTQPNIQMWLIQALGVFGNETASFPALQQVAATAVATRGSSQSTCPMPIALRPNGGGPPNYGYTPGQWVTLLMSPGSGGGGYIGWANLDGSNSAAETERELNGFCGVRIGDDLGTPGVQASTVDAWNTRFGIYRNARNPWDPNSQPDFTGYAYTATNWPSQQNAYNGPVPAGAHPTAQNFLTKRQAFASCADTGTRVRGPNSCESIIDRSMAGGFTHLAAPGPAPSDGHRAYGVNRRIVTVPVTLTYPGGSVADYACMLLLQPLSIPTADIQLEFIGNASAPGSPCTTSGLPGGAAGPLVPVLVR